MSLVRVCPWKKLLMRNAICMIMWINYSELNEHSNHNREEDDHPWPLPTEISGGWWIVSVQSFSVISMWNRSSSEQLMYVQEEECGKLIKCTKFWAEFLNKSTANYSHLLNRFGGSSKCVFSSSFARKWGCSQQRQVWSLEFLDNSRSSVINDRDFKIVK